MYPPSVIQEIKDRLSLVAFIAETIPLKKAGRNYKGLCPFHQEKTPSFLVHDDKQIFHCFGCGEGGDLVHFVMRRQGLNFPEAIELLAERAGVTLPVSTDTKAQQAAESERQHRKLGLRVNTLATEYFQERLRAAGAGDAALNYLKSRGYEDSAFFTQHFLGYAEDGWEGLATFLQQRNVPMELAMQLGLVKKRPRGEGYYDFFRGRLIFPIRNVKGEVVAFGGRVVPGAGAPDDAAKYLNSPDSPLFHKSETMYGFPMAASAMRAADRAIVVEGYLDVLALHRVGLAETVAPLGTALTAKHLRLITRYTRNIWLVFDGDTAGENAAMRSLPVFLEGGLVPRVVLLPAGEDPDSFVAKAGGEAFAAQLPTAPTLFEWVIDSTVAAAGTGTAGRVQAVNALKPLFAKLGDPIQEAAYVRRLAQRIRIDESAVLRALRGQRDVIGPKPAQSPQVAKASPSATDPLAVAERSCLAFLFHVPEGARVLISLIAPADFRVPAHRQLAEWCWRLYAEHRAVAVDALLACTEDAAMRSLVTGLACTAGEFDDVTDESIPMVAQSVVQALRRAQEREAIGQVREALMAAEAAGDTDTVTRLMQDLQQRHQERNKPHAG